MPILEKQYIGHLGMAYYIYMCVCVCACARMCVDQVTLSVTLSNVAPPNKILNWYFENPIIGLHVLYFFSTNAKFCFNIMLLTIQSINSYLCIILKFKKFKHLIVEIVIDLWSSWNFAIMDVINRKHNPTANVKKKYLNNITLLKIMCNTNPTIHIVFLFSWHIWFFKSRFIEHKICLVFVPAELVQEWISLFLVSRPILEH